VKVEEVDGTYACFICSESVRGGDALYCAQCSSNPVHVACVRGSPFAETCAQCSGKGMRPWTGRAGGDASSSATIDLVAAEAKPAILNDADQDSEPHGGEDERGTPQFPQPLCQTRVRGRLQGVSSVAVCRACARCVERVLESVR
jgi:hypothetical protein